MHEESHRVDDEGADGSGMLIATGVVLLTGGGILMGGLLAETWERSVIRWNRNRTAKRNNKTRMRDTDGDRQ